MRVHFGVLLALNRHTHHVAPFGPGTVVDARVVEAKQVFKDKPRVGCLGANVGVKDGLGRGLELAVVDFELAERAEATVGVDRAIPF